MSRSSTPTVFEQQREDLVREIAVVCPLSIFDHFNFISCMSMLYETTPNVEMGNKTHSNRAWSKFCKISID